MSTRRVILSAAMSLDGYIATPDGGYDWIPAAPEIDMVDLFKGFDTILMGRRSYEVVLRDGHLSQYELPIIVFSSTLRPEEHPGVTVARDAAATVRALRAAPGKDLWLFGGGDLFRRFLEQDLVDGVELAVCPVLLGAGLPLLPGGALRQRLTLTRHRVYEPSGMALLTYAVARAEAGAAQ